MKTFGKFHKDLCDRSFLKSKKPPEERVMHSLIGESSGFTYKTQFYFNQYLEVVVLQVKSKVSKQHPQKRKHIYWHSIPCEK